MNMQAVILAAKFGGAVFLAWVTGTEGPLPQSIKEGFVARTKEDVFPHPSDAFPKHTFDNKTLVQGKEVSTQIVSFNAATHHWPASMYVSEKAQSYTVSSFEKGALKTHDRDVKKYRKMTEPKRQDRAAGAPGSTVAGGAQVACAT